MTRQTGLIQRTRTAKKAYAGREFVCKGTGAGGVLQRIVSVRDQLAKPSCVGQALASCVDALDPRAARQQSSAVDLWVDARRRQGNLEEVKDGTRLEYALDSLVERGWSPYIEGEDSRPLKDDGRIDSLAGELAAFDHRSAGVEHFTIEQNRVRSIIDALSLGRGVVISTGTRPSYFTPPMQTVLGPDYLGGAENGHAQRVVGYDPQREAFIVLNSWGANWGGCVASFGVVLPGCVFVSHGVIESAWDIDVIDFSNI